MNDLSATRRNRRPPLVIAGTLLFALLAVLSGVEALRGDPPTPAEGSLPLPQLTRYRAAAAAVCGGIAVWIFVAGNPRRDDRPSLLR